MTNEMLIVIVALCAATSWLVAYWIMVGLRHTWRLVCTWFVGRTAGLGAVQFGALMRARRGLTSLPLGNKPDTSEVRRSIVSALGELDQQEMRAVSAGSAIRRWLSVHVGRLARSLVRADLARTDAVMCVMGDVPQAVTKGAYAMAGGKDFEREEIVAGLTRALEHGPEEDFDNHLHNVEEFIEEPEELDQLRLAVKGRPESLRKSGSETIERIAARLSS